MMAYRVDLTPDDNGTFLVTCPSIPMVATFGETREAALHHAVDAIEVALGALIADGEDIPPPDGEEPLVRVPLLTALKVELHMAMREAGVTRAELGRRLSWTREAIDRLFRLDHAARVAEIEAAFHALGRRVDINVHEAA